MSTFLLDMIDFTCPNKPQTACTCQHMSRSIVQISRWLKCHDMLMSDGVIWTENSAIGFPVILWSFWVACFTFVRVFLLIPKGFWWFFFSLLRDQGIVFVQKYGVLFGWNAKRSRGWIAVWNLLDYFCIIIMQERFYDNIFQSPSENKIRLIRISTFISHRTHLYFSWLLYHY